MIKEIKFIKSDTVLFVYLDVLKNNSLSIYSAHISKLGPCQSLAEGQNFEINFHLRMKFRFWYRSTGSTSTVFKQRAGIFN